MHWATKIVCGKCTRKYVVKHEEDSLFPHFCPFCGKDGRKAKKTIKG